ncbi:MAG TPA: response regulator, partial [Terriglobales bacterium]|nr:response regulator [Terriglobales bacterium]
MPRDRVLVVEDETQFLEAVISYLTGKDYDVVSCKTWAEAATLWRTSRPDVVLLDHNLPDGNALDLIMPSSFRSRYSYHYAHGGS